MPGAPVFVSYRQTDGTDTVTELTWLLRAAGIPVWHDQSDLPPGETEQRLEDALAAGLSGAILLVTPDIAKSNIVQHVELPLLLRLASDPAFAFAVANKISKPNGKLAYDAPDQLLGQPRVLAALKQYPARTRDELVALVREMVKHRAGRIAAAGRTLTTPLHVSLQTRGSPVTLAPHGADMPIMLQPATAGRLPDRRGALDFQATLPILPTALARAGAAAVRISGGAHLSLAFAVGAALPATLVGTLTAEGRDGAPWTSGPIAAAGGSDLVHAVSRGMGTAKPAGAPRSVVAYVDLLPTASDAAYTRLLTETPDFDAWQHLRPTAAGAVDPAIAGRLVDEIADRLRALSQRHENATLHLLLRCPFPVAVLLGRLCNTIRTVVYEWDDSPVPGDPDVRARYVPVVAVSAGHADGPITEVLLPTTTPAPATGTTQ